MRYKNYMNYMGLQQCCLLEYIAEKVQALGDSGNLQFLFEGLE